MSPSPPPPPPPPPPSFSIPGRPRKETDPSSGLPPATNSSPPTLEGVPERGPPGTVLVSLLVYNGYPFADHWEYLAAPPAAADPDPSSDSDPHRSTGAVGAVIQAAGDVRSGFWLEVRRGWRAEVGDDHHHHPPSTSSSAGVGVGVPRRVRLAWVPGEYFRADADADADADVEAGGGSRKRTVFEGREDGEVLVERQPRCEFERILFRVPAPEKTLRAVDGSEASDLLAHNQAGNRGREKITQRNCQTWVIESAEELVREGIFEQRVVDYLRATSIMKV
ncbi:hypothetical protein L209DRAFT_100012 [Thermothelomyces heterothallicus CBS 203.75]